MRYPSNKQQLIELTIESIGFKGISIARNDGLVYFVKGGVPGDKMLAEIRRKRKRHIEAEIVELIEPSANRIEPKCKYFGACGGCTWQNISYGEQIRWKKQQVIDAFRRIGKIEVGEIIDTIPAPQLFNYRNKMDFSFGASRWLSSEEIQKDEDIDTKNFALGLHIPGRYDKILDIDSCHIQAEEGNQVLRLFKQKALELNVAAYSEQTRKGFLRNLVLRFSRRDDEMMSILVTNNPLLPEDDKFLNWYRYDFPSLFPNTASIINAINADTNPVSFGKINFIEGKDFINEEILGIEYKISPFSFFQTNSYQLDTFIGKILEFAQLGTSETIWDLYCGIGSITLPASHKCKQIFGFELIESSIEDAQINAKLNNIENVQFKALDLHSKNIYLYLDKYEIPDTVILDPPRNGMHQQLVQYILDLYPKKIVYVSCNPTTQARDCELLSEKYNVIKIQPIDMFPHTYHIESIALLERKHREFTK